MDKDETNKANSCGEVEAVRRRSDALARQLTAATGVEWGGGGASPALSGGYRPVASLRLGKRIVDLFVFEMKDGTYKWQVVPGASNTEFLNTNHADPVSAALEGIKKALECVGDLDERLLDAKHDLIVALKHVECADIALIELQENARSRGLWAQFEEGLLMIAPGWDKEPEGDQDIGVVQHPLLHVTREGSHYHVNYVGAGPEWPEDMYDVDEKKLVLDENQMHELLDHLEQVVDGTEPEIGFEAWQTIGVRLPPDMQPTPVYTVPRTCFPAAASPTEGEYLLLEGGTQDLTGRFRIVGFRDEDVLIERAQGSEEEM